MHASDAQTPPPRRLPWRTALLTLLVVAIVAVIGAFSWGVRRYNRLIESGNNVESRFAGLARRIPFAPPDGREASDERMRLMLTAREAMIAALPADSAESARRLLLETGGRGLAAGRLTLALSPDLERAAMRLADSLESQGMSPAEYRLLLGALVAETLKEEGGDPVGDAYRRVAGRVAGLRDRLGDADASMPSAPQLESIRNRYAGRGAFDRSLTARLRAENPIVYALDLVALTAGPRLGAGVGTGGAP
jgi:hypothetical protein